MSKGSITGSGSIRSGSPSPCLMPEVRGQRSEVRGQRSERTLTHAGHNGRLSLSSDPLTPFDSGSSCSDRPGMERIPLLSSSARLLVCSSPRLLVSSPPRFLASSSPRLLVSSPRLLVSYPRLLAVIPVSLIRITVFVLTGDQKEILFDPEQKRQSATCRRDRPQDPPTSPAHKTRPQDPPTTLDPEGSQS